MHIYRITYNDHILRETSYAYLCGDGFGAAEQAFRRKRSGDFFSIVEMEDLGAYEECDDGADGRDGEGSEGSEPTT